MGAIDHLDGKSLQSVLAFCYVPFSAASDAVGLVNKSFHTAFRSLPGECVRAIMREYALSEDRPTDLPDDSEESLEEYRHRVFLMGLTTLCAHLRLRTGHVANDVAALYPGLDPNPDILVDFCPPKPADRRRIQTLVQNATVRFQSSPFDAEWIPFDAFSDRLQYSVHHKWVRAELPLPGGSVAFEYHDSFEHEDPNFGPFGLAMRTVQATAATSEVAATLGLDADGPTVVSQQFKECHEDNRFRYFLRTDFFSKLARALGWEGATVQHTCTFVSIILTQTHRRAFGSLLLHSNSVMRMDRPCPDPIGQLRDNLKLVYPSKDGEAGRAETLGGNALSTLQSRCALPIEEQLFGILQLRDHLQSAYDGVLVARTRPPVPVPLRPYGPPPVPPMPHMTSFNPALNSFHLTSFHHGGFPPPPFPPPPFGFFPGLPPFGGPPRPPPPHMGLSYPAANARGSFPGPFPVPPRPTAGPSSGPPATKAPPQGDSAPQVTENAEAAPAATGALGNGPPSHQSGWEHSGGGGSGYKGKGKGKGKGGKGRPWSGRLPGASGNWGSTPAAASSRDTAKGASHEEPKPITAHQWPQLGAEAPKPQRRYVPKASLQANPPTQAAEEGAPAPAAAEDQGEEPAAPSAPKTGKKKWRPLGEVLGK
jgi:hypothetical protein